MKMVTRRYVWLRKMTKKKNKKQNFSHYANRPFCFTWFQMVRRVQLLTGRSIFCLLFIFATPKISSEFVKNKWIHISIKKFCFVFFFAKFTKYVITSNSFVESTLFSTSIWKIHKKIKIAKFSYSLFHLLLSVSLTHFHYTNQFIFSFQPHHHYCHIWRFTCRALD